jgi:hypothetical protein
MFGSEGIDRCLDHVYVLTHGRHGKLHEFARGHLFGHIVHEYNHHEFDSLYHHGILYSEWL